MTNAKTGILADHVIQFFDRSAGKQVSFEMSAQNMLIFHNNMLFVLVAVLVVVVVVVHIPELWCEEGRALRPFA